MEKKNQGDSITIVTVCDNNYIMLLASLLKSIEVNNTHGRPIEFYIVEDNISNRNKDKFEDSFFDNSIVIHWLKMASVVPKEAIIPSDSSTYPLNIYVRLFIPQFIPSKIRRVIYLDVDMVTEKDISELWETDIGDEIIGAVQDTFGTAFHGI